MYYQINAKGRVVSCNGFDLSALLNLASAEIMIGRADNALSLLSKARLIARDMRNQSGKVIATQCTIAMQALMPEALEDTILSPAFDDLFRPVTDWHATITFDTEDLGC